MIFFDGTHLVSDESVKELNAFAQNVGLKREWLQGGQRLPHYDVTTQRMRRKIRAAGIVSVTERGVVIACIILRTGGRCKWNREDIFSKYLRR